jgi:D-alanyl-D-alanine carboxypeptidase
MVTLALRLHDRFPRFYPLFAMRTFTWGSETYRSHNTLLFHYRGLEGLKTGYIRASGFNLVAAARRGKKHVFVAYFGGKTAALRNAAVRAHLDAGFAKAAEQRTRRPLAVAVEGPSADEKAKSEPVGGEAKGGTVAGLPAPLPAKRAATADGIEIARVRPVRVGAPDTKPKLSPRAEPAAEDDDEAPTLTPTLTPKGAFHVQIGAYQTKDEAKRQLASVSERAGTVLGDHAAYTSQVKRGDKTFFRARYVGFAAHASAADVCSELKLMEIDCLVMKAE